MLHETADHKLLNAIAMSVTLGILTLLWIAWLRPLLQSKKPHPLIPMLPGSHWLFGHLFWLLNHDFIGRQQVIRDHSDRHGRCSVWLGPRLPSISLTRIEDAHKLLRNHHTRHPVPILKYHFERLAGRNNLLMLNGRKWKHYQSALKATLIRFDPLQLQRIAQITTQTLVDNIKAKIRDSDGPIRVDSIENLMKMITIDVFGKAAFSHDFGSCAALHLCPFASAFEYMEKDILDRCNNNALLPQNLLYWIPTRRNKAFNERRRLLRGTLTDIIRRRRSSGKQIDDILSKIIETHSEGYIAMSDEDLVDVLLSILMAGYDTVSTALSYAIYLLARHPEWEAKCLEEINTATINADKTVELPICRGVIMEALRIYPVATATSRVLERPLALDDNVTIPKGYHVGVSFWIIHRSDLYFEDALSFRPDRWIPRTSNTSSRVSVANPKAFFAFSAGARTCPGQHFALKEASLALAGLLLGLKFSIDPDFMIEVGWRGIVQRPKGGIPATISMRS